MKKIFFPPSLLAHTFLRILATLFLCLWILSSPSSILCFSQNEPTLMDGASLYNKEGLLVLHLKGNPYQMGYQHGVLLKEDIKIIYNDYLIHRLKVITKTKWKHWLAFHFFKRKALAMEKYIPKEYRDEMKGIADGSGLVYTDVLIINTWLDVVSNPRIFKKEFKTCANFVTINQGEEGVGLIHGRNLSWPSQGLLEKHTVVAFYEPTDGNRFVALTWPGVAGLLTGMNAQGVTIGEASVGTIDSTLRGMPIFFLLRQALQYGDTIYDSIRNIVSSRRTTGYNVTLSDGKLDKACLLEIAANHYAVTFTGDGVVTSTNHYQNDTMFQTMKPVYKNQKIRLEDSSSYQRLVHIKEMIRDDHNHIDPQQAQDILSDQTICTTGTFLSMVFEPKDLQFWVAVGHPTILKKKFVNFNLGQELNISPMEKEVFLDPQEFYSYSKERLNVLKTLIKEGPSYREFRVVFPSVVHTSFFDNKVYLKIYEPKGVEHFPVVVILPHFAGGSEMIEGRFARSLTEEGIGAVMVNMGHQQDGRVGHLWLQQELDKDDLTNIYQFFRQLVVESRRTIDWLEEDTRVDKDRIGLMGISLGAVIGPIVVAVDERIKSAIYFLGGGDISSIVYRGRQLPDLKKRLNQEDILPAKFENKYAMIDPLTFAFKAKRVPTVMYNSLFDDIIPRTSTLKLWRALDEPSMYWIPARHYTAALFLGNAMYVTAKHFGSTLKLNTIETAKKPKIQVTEHAEVVQSHKGVQMIAAGKYGDREKRIRLGLRKENFLHTPFFSGFDLSSQWDGDDRFRLKGRGQDVYMGLMITKKTKLTLKYEHQDFIMYKVSQTAPDVFKDDQGASHVNNTALVLEKSSLNNRYYPTKGTNDVVEWDHASKGLGSQYNFNRLIWQFRDYLTPGRFFTYAFRTKLGWINQFGSSLDVPFEERFFAGGSGTIRGYKGRQLGPKDDSNLPLGGDLFWINNFEARFPIYKKLMGAYFVDVGNLWAKSGQLRFDDFKYSTGVGLRYLTPWGVFRMDYGARLSHEPSEPQGELSVTFGIPF